MILKLPERVVFGEEGASHVSGARQERRGVLEAHQKRGIPMKSTRPTMKDVAREAGVALGTVSKVMNNIPVGDEYRIRVEEAAERLGYRINT